MSWSVCKFESRKGLYMMPVVAEVIKKLKLPFFKVITLRQFICILFKSYTLQ